MGEHWTVRAVCYSEILFLLSGLNKLRTNKHGMPEVIKPFLILTVKPMFWLIFEKTSKFLFLSPVC